MIKTPPRQTQTFRPLALLLAGLTVTLAAPEASAQFPGSQQSGSQQSFGRPPQSNYGRQAPPPEDEKIVIPAASLVPAPPVHYAPSQPVDRIVAVVNEGVILESELQRGIAAARRQLRLQNVALPPDDELRPQVLERLVIIRLQTQKAQEAGVRIDDKELNDVMTNMAQQQGQTPAQFAEALRTDGLDYLDVREQVRDELLVNRVREKEVAENVQVTDQDVDMFLANQASTDPTRYHLGHILVAVPESATDRQKKKAREKIDDIRTRLLAGGDFTRIATTESDASQALKGGDMGTLRLVEMPGLFAEATPRMTPGTISPVLEDASGYHILKLLDRQTAEKASTVQETRAQHILLTPNQLRDEDATRRLSQQIYDRIKAGEDFAVLAKQFSDDPGSKQAGGDLGFTAPGIFAPEFQIRIDELKVGEVSPPFHTQFGWHIARVTQRRDRDVTDTLRRNQARNSIGQRRLNDDYETWLRHLRDEAYTEYRLAPASAATDAPVAPPAPVVAPAPKVSAAATTPTP